VLKCTGEIRKHEGISARQIPPHVRDEEKDVRKGGGDTEREARRRTRQKREGKRAEAEAAHAGQTSGDLGVPSGVPRDGASASYGIAESIIHATIRWVKNTLVKDWTFSLPGKKALAKGASVYEVVLVDATETPIECPKKNSGGSAPARKRDAR